MSEHPVIKVAKREVAIAKGLQIQTEIPYVKLPVDHVAYLINQTERARVLEKEVNRLRKLEEIN